MGMPAGFGLVGLLFFCLHHSCFPEVTANKVCQAILGKKVITFSKTGEMIKIPCKYNAVRDLQCGDWLITVSPGNKLDSYRKKNYIVNTMFVAVRNVNTNKYWEGRSDLKIAKKYKLGYVDEPFKKKEGNLETSAIFNYGDPDIKNEVSLTEKNNQFKIVFGLFEPDGDWHKSSGFTFECLSDTFIPSVYPTEICGNGTTREVKRYKRSKRWKGNRSITLFWSIFSSVDTVQTQTHCKAAADSMQLKCKTVEEQYDAAKKCWTILGKGNLRKCYSRNGDDPIEVFRYCVEYMCTGEKKPCQSLGAKLDMCPNVKAVSTAVRDQCYSSLVIA